MQTSKVASVIIAIMVAFVAPVAAMAGDRPDMTSGSVEFRIQAGNFADGTVYVSDTKANRTFDPAFHYDGSEVSPDQNSGFVKVRINPDGASTPARFAVGHYVAYIQRGQADHPEMKEFDIGAAEMTYVVFMGQARPSPGTPVAEPTPEPNETPNTTEVCYPAVTHVQHVPAVYGEREIMISAAYTEHIPEQNHTIMVPEEHHVVHHAAVTHTETVIDTPAYTTYAGDYAYHSNGGYYQYENGVNAMYVVDHANVDTHGDYKKVGGHYEYITGTYHGTRYNVSFKYGCATHHPAVTHQITVTDHEAYNEVVVDVPAHEQIVVDHPAETVYHDAVFGTEEYIVTTGHDEIVVDVPAHCEQVPA